MSCLVYKIRLAMPEDQKLDLIWVVKTWGAVITILLGTLISVLVYVYFDHKENQQRINEDTQQFMRRQTIANNIIFDVMTHYHPDANDKIHQFFSKHESMSTRSVK